ncbi:MAG: Hpt domain-containing protein [Leptolyngbya sp. SIO1D8]|nr:Hpt domain-containing protein [Leptolyngbya sp. SIO1D8]
MIENEAVPVFDRSVLLECLGGDEEGAAEICQIFLEDFPNDLQALQTGLQAGDASHVEYTAHGIKGAAANVGGEALRAVALKIEKAAKVGDLAAAEHHLAELETQFARLQEAIENSL